MFRIVFFCLCFWRLDGWAITPANFANGLGPWVYKSTGCQFQVRVIFRGRDVIDAACVGAASCVALCLVLEQSVDGYCVFGDEDELKLMMKGESFTLNSDLTEIKDDVIQWKFGDEDALIAEINKRADRIAVYDDVLDGRFRDRLKLNNQTASLTIINITKVTGYYSLQINGVRKRKINIGFIVEISVKEGESLTVNSDLTEIKDYDWIRWMFGDENILIVEINVKADRITVYDDYLGRFRDRLKLDKQTGSLTITNITTEHAGDYKLQIKSTREFRLSESFSLKAFRVSVSASL
ncbi:unnamed protein product [Leuciscus chuanchicus]